MKNYRELFVSQFLDDGHYAAVIYEKGKNCFYDALFEYVWFGGYSDYSLKNKGNAISIDVVRNLARKSEDRRAPNYVDITEDNWREVVVNSVVPNDNHP